MSSADQREAGKAATAVKPELVYRAVKNNITLVGSLIDVSPSQVPPLGKVYLVGAGPGDPGLMTLRGAECLAAADLVLYDYLVNPRVLQHAPARAELVCLGRHGQGRIMSQAEINGRLVAAAREGRSVVRLKSGDPMIFARGAEEIEALVSAGIPFEVVPGLTAALAASSYAGIPLTHRDVASAVALVTGQEQDAKGDAAIDYARLATFPGTLVFYMGVTSARQWTEALIRGGKSPDTPAAIVRRCSWPDQSSVRCTLAEVPAVLESRRIRPPVIVIVGQVVDVEPTIGWFSQRPLFGRGVLITRPVEQSDELRNRFEALGAAVYVQPAIEIGPPDDWSPVDAALQRVEEFDWLVFSSANGVRYLLDRLLERHGDIRRLGRARLATIGPATARELERYGLRADLQPEAFRAESLADALAGEAQGKRFLLARASRGREVLADELRAAAAQVEQVVVYRSSDVGEVDAEVIEALDGGQVHWITVTSSAIARSLANLLGERLRMARLASISPITSGTLRELGYEPTVEAAVYTTEGLVEAILTADGS